MDIYEYAKTEFEKQYDSKVTIQMNEPVKVGTITRTQWIDKVSDQPCRISQKQLTVASDGDIASLSYVTTLYCDPSVDIPAGCRLKVTDIHGNVRCYKRSSEGFSSYRTHQEVVILRDVKA